jgi:hypothetical protein
VKLYLASLKVKYIQEVDGQMAQKKAHSQDTEQVEDLVEFPEHLVQSGSGIQDKQVVVEVEYVVFLVGVDVDNADLVLEEFLVQF